ASPGAGEEQIKAIRRELGLDQPVIVQYARYLRDLAVGNLGRSIQTGQPVINDLVVRLPATFELALLSMALYIVVSIPLGVLAAVRHGRVADLIIRLGSVAGLAVPAFWLGFLLQLVFYRQLAVFPDAIGRLSPAISPSPFVTGFYLVDSLLAGNPRVFGSTVAHLVMPVAVLVISRLGLGVKLTRESVLEVLGADYVRTARAKGLRERVVLYRHVLRNALLSVVTALGMQFGYLLGNTLVVESVFGWPGIGTYAIGSITTLDFPAIMAVTLIIAVCFVIINYVVDVLVFYLDPRVTVG
ncbi:MAG: ABC transporter permease, partial [Candidatus Rokubacteria bacterium]|nr:ABC transporter permease [Candidatus Rokubacteria bacterium]